MRHSERLRSLCLCRPVRGLNSSPAPLLSLANRHVAVSQVVLDIGIDRRLTASRSVQLVKKVAGVIASVERTHARMSGRQCARIAGVVRLSAHSRPTTPFGALYSVTRRRCVK